MMVVMVVMAMEISTVTAKRVKLPDFNIYSCPPAPINWAKTANSSGIPFYLTDCSSPAIQQTEIFACYDNNNLYFHFECIDNNIYSIYTECNQDLYNQGSFPSYFILSLNLNYFEQAKQSIKLIPK